MAKSPWNRQSGPQKRQPAKPQGKKSGKEWDTPSDANSREKREDRHFLSKAFWTAASLALFGFFLWYFRPYSPLPPLVVLTVAGYQAPLPPNSFAVEDALGFERLHKSNSFQRLRNPKILIYRPVVDSPKDPWKQQLCAKLHGSTPAGPDKHNKVVMVYISAHGLIDQDGKPCLFIPGESKKWDSSTWIRVSDLLTDLFPQDNASDCCRADVLKLVILDANRMDSNPSLGLLYNAFADGLKEAVAEAGVKRLYVLNSTSPGQLGWAEPVLRASVFADCLQRGLAGAADRESGANPNGEVTLGELKDYVVAKVFNWVSIVHQEEQVPMLVPHPSDEDLAVPLVATANKTVETAVCSPIDYPDGTSDAAAQAAESENKRIWKKIKDFWKRHGDLADSSPPPYRRHPFAWAKLEAQLLRLEQLADAGKKYKDQRLQLERQIKGQLEDLEKTSKKDGLATFSLPLTRLFEKTPSEQEKEAAQAAFKSLEEEIDADETGQPDEAETTDKPANPVAETAPAESPDADKSAKDTGSSPTPDAVPQSETAPPPPDALAPPSPPDYLSQANVAWRNFLQHPEENLEIRRKVLSAIKRPDRADVIEILFLRMANEYLASELWMDGEIIKSILAARELAEKAAAPGDERTFHGIRKMVEDGDLIRRKAEDELFAWGGSVQSDGRTELAKPPISDYENAVKDYEKAIADAELLRRAFAVRDRALATLPFLCRWNELMPEENVEPGSKEGRLWQAGQVVQKTLEIDELLNPAVGLEEEQSTQLASLLSKIKEPLSELRITLDKLEGKFNSDYSDVREAGDDAGKLRDMTRILAMARLNGKARVDFIDDQRRLYRSRAESASEELVSVELTPPKVAETPLPTGKQLPILKLLRPILREELVGVEDDKPVRREVLGKIGASIRTSLNDASAVVEKSREEAKQLAKAGVCLKVRKPLADADHSVRRLSCYLAGGNWLTRSVESDEPAARLRRFDLSQMLLWHAERALDDFWASPPCPATEAEPNPKAPDPWFEMAAKGYKKSANDLVSKDFAPSDPPGMKYVEDLLQDRVKAAKHAVQPIADLVLWFDHETRGYEPLDIRPDPHQSLPPGTAALHLEYWDENPRGEGKPLLIKSADLGLVRRMPVPVSRPAENLGLSLPIDDKMKSNQVTAEIVYRGHHKEDYFQISAASSLETQWQRPEDSPATVVVHGDSKRKVPVIFVLDCSLSMATPLRLREGRSAVNRRDETQDNQAEGKGQRRIDVMTKTLLERVLPELEDDRYEIGIRAYGHRNGFDKKWNVDCNKSWDKNSPILSGDSEKIPRLEGNGRINPKWKEHLTTGGHPAYDVELVRDRRIFRSSQIADIKTLLGGLKPLGQTPLYLAVIQAIEKDLRGIQGRGHVVVITDGLNIQESPDEIGLDTRQSPGTWHVEEALADNRNVFVDFICFDLDPAEMTRPENLRAWESFNNLAIGNDRVAIVEAANAGILEKKLEESLRICRYDVGTKDNLGLVASKKQLGTKVEFRRELVPGAYQVTVHGPRDNRDSRIHVSGGEALTLFFEEESGGASARLVHRRYGLDGLDKDRLNGNCFVPRIPVAEDAPKNPTEAAVYVGVHDPESGGQKNTKVFHVSIQNAEATLFSHRPQEVWMEVTPKFGPEGSTEGKIPYILWDAEFVPERPVPVLRFQANNWPKEATGADLSLFCKFAKTEVDQTCSVGNLTRQGSLELEPPDGVKFEVRTEPPGNSGSPADSEFPHQIVVIGQGKKARDWKVEISPPPDRIRHRFVDDKDTVAHRFDYRQLDGDIKDCQLRFTSRKKLERNATSLGKPLLVPED